MRRNSLTSIGAIGTAAAILALAACGGGSDTTPDDVQRPVVSDPIPALELPLATPRVAQLAPVIRFGDELRVGGMPPPRRGDLASVATHAGATVRYGRIHDGVGGNILTRYLNEDSTLASDGIHRFAEAPVVRYVAGTTAERIDEIVRAVMLINANLPRDFQLTVDPTPVSAADDAAGGLDGSLEDGQILIEFDRREDWEIPNSGGTYTSGQATTWTNAGQITTARVYVDDTRTSDAANRMDVLVHETIHALGRLHANRSRFPHTVMHDEAEGTQGYVMHRLDREALLAVYSVLDPDDYPADIAAHLGSWENESLHVRGELGDLAFGASLRNGLVRPWALGPRPGVDLADNPQLMGSASWSGRLLGLTPSGDSVAGAAGLGIDLDSLSGDLEFSSLESWSGAPGETGSGAMWGDGDLNYDVAVRGNVFGRSGGDEGIVTGAFFGASHDGMGGTLVRDDLSAGFGGTR